MIPQEELLTGVRWKILSELAKRGTLTSAELAKYTDTTLPGISQATTLLEAYGYISTKGIPKKKPGKPHKKYTLKKNTAQLTICVDGFAQRLTVTPNPIQTALLRTFVLSEEDSRWMQKLLCTHDHLLEDIDAIAFLSSEKAETHILVLTEDVTEYRKQYSSITLSSGKESRKVVSWSHNFAEFHSGLQQNEKYFKDLVRKAIIIYDPKQLVVRAQHG